MRSGQRDAGGARPHAGYDGIAWVYDRHWRDLHEKALTALGRVLLGRLPRGARILDLCCGAGHLAAALARRGYSVTGIDVSPEMLRYARANVPGAEFLVADARDFHLPGGFHAAISTFDSLNHVLSSDDLARVFQNVHRALAPGGMFVFDLNMAEAYRTEWRKWSAIVEADLLCVVRGGYDRKRKIGRTEITLFRLEDVWTRSEVVLYQKCHSQAEVREGLKRAGFGEIRVRQARRDLGIRGRLAVGRRFFSALKPNVPHIRASSPAKSNGARHSQ